MSLGTADIEIDGDLSKFRRSLETGARKIVAKTQAGLPAVNVKMDIDKKSLASLRGLGSSFRTQIFSDPQAAILKLSAAFTGLLGTMGPIGPTLAGIGAGAVAATGVVSSLGLAVGVAALGFNNFGAAVSKGGDALDKLTPSAREAAVAVRSLSGPWQDLQKSIQEKIFSGLAGDIGNLSKTITGGLKPGFDSIAVSLNRLIGGFVQWATSTKGIEQINVLMTGLAGTFSNLVPGIAGLGKGLLGVFLAALPAVQNMASALGDAGKRFGEWAHSVEGQDALANFFGTITTLVTTFKNLASVVGPVLGPLVDAFGVLGPSLDRVRAAILPVAQTLTTTIGQGITKMLPDIKRMGENFAGLIEQIQPFAKFMAQVFGGAIVGLIKGFVNVVDGVVDVFRGLLDFFGAVFTGQWGKAWDAIKQIFSGALQAIIGAFQVWMNASFLGIFRRMFTAIPGILRSGWTKVTGFFQSALSGIANGLKSAFTGYLNLWRGLFRGVFTAVKVGWQAIRTGFSSALGGIRIAVSGALKAVRTTFSTVFTAITGFVRTRLSNLVNNFKALPGRLKALGGKMLDAGRSLMGKLFDGLKNAAGAVGGFATNIAGAIWDKLKGLLNKILPHSLTINPPGPLGPWKVPLFPKFAKGTMFAPGGLSLVGEEGPELVDLPRGSRVKTARQTQEMIAGSQTPQTVEVNQNFYGPTTSRERLRELEWTLRYATRPGVGATR